MANRKHSFAEGEYYHCYNRGTEKREVFCDEQDYAYFLKALYAYNTSKVFGKMKLTIHKKQENPPVHILAYCLLPNHYHLVLRNNTDQGISKYLQRVGGGYTMYFNKKYNRSGALFQGTFKSKYVASDQDMRHLLAYVSLNYKIHSIKNPSLYRAHLNMDEPLVRGLTSELDNDSLNEIVEIIKQKRLDM